MGCITGCLGELGLFIIIIRFLASMPWPLSELWFWIIAGIGSCLLVGWLVGLRESRRIL